MSFYHLKAIKRVRIVRRSDGYYCQFCIAVERNISIEPTGRAVGIDVGLAKFYTASDGKTVDNPRHLRKAECSLKRAQRRVSSKLRRSKKEGEKLKQSSRYSIKNVSRGTGKRIRLGREQPLFGTGNRLK